MSRQLEPVCYRSEARLERCKSYHKTLHSRSPNQSFVARVVRCTCVYMNPVDVGLIITQKYSIGVRNLFV